MTTRTIFPALVALALMPVLAGAEEPVGFDGFDFGTPRSSLAQPLADRCRPAPQVSPPTESGPRVICPGYVLTDFGAVTVALLFTTEDRLEGYVVYIPETGYKDARNRVTTRFGPPTKTWEQGRTLSWRWPSGAHASLTDLCVGKQGCLTVKARDESDAGLRRKR